LTLVGVALARAALYALRGVRSAWCAAAEMTTGLRRFVVVSSGR